MLSAIAYANAQTENKAGIDRMTTKANLIASLRCLICLRLLIVSFLCVCLYVINMRYGKRFVNR